MQHMWHIDASLPIKGSRRPYRPQGKLLDVQPRGPMTIAASAQACSTRARGLQQSAARCSVRADMCLVPSQLSRLHGWPPCAAAEGHQPWQQHHEQRVQRPFRASGERCGPSQAAGSVPIKPSYLLVSVPATLGFVLAGSRAPQACDAEVVSRSNAWRAFERVLTGARER